MHSEPFPVGWAHQRAPLLLTELAVGSVTFACCGPLGKLRVALHQRNLAVFQLRLLKELKRTTQFLLTFHV
jgi:hypothetical protein